jgi:hypothetical protein
MNNDSGGMQMRTDDSLDSADSARYVATTDARQHMSSPINTEISMETILVDPTAEDSAESGTGAVRLPGLQGMRIGLLDNIKHNAVYLLEEIGERLTREHGCDVRMVRKKTYTRFCEPAVLAQLEDCNAVVTAIGD